MTTNWIDYRSVIILNNNEIHDVEYIYHVFVSNGPRGRILNVLTSFKYPFVKRLTVKALVEYLKKSPNVNGIPKIQRIANCLAQWIFDNYKIDKPLNRDELGKLIMNIRGKPSFTLYDYNYSIGFEYYFPKFKPNSRGTENEIIIELSFIYFELFTKWLESYLKCPSLFLQNQKYMIACGFNRLIMKKYVDIFDYPHHCEIVKTLLTPSSTFLDPLKMEIFNVYSIDRDRLENLNLNIHVYFEEV